MNYADISDRPYPADFSETPSNLFAFYLIFELIF